LSRVVAIVPAAGASRRMGRDKLLLPWGDTVVIGSVLRALAQGGVGETVVVVRPDNPDLELWLRDAGVGSVINPAPERGMLSSIQAGLAALGGASELARHAVALLVCPADLPAVQAQTVSVLIDRIATGSALAVPTFRGRRGHPLAVSAELVPEIPGLAPQIGLRQLVDRHRDALVEVHVEDRGAVRDLDTPADYENALRAL
jgi:molybdenum cofactor cytidylyltransferase